MDDELLDLRISKLLLEYSNTIKCGIISNDNMLHIKNLCDIYNVELYVDNLLNITINVKGLNDINTLELNDLHKYVNTLIDYINKQLYLFNIKYKGLSIHRNHIRLLEYCMKSEFRNMLDLYIGLELAISKCTSLYNKLSFMYNSKFNTSNEIINPEDNIITSILRSYISSDDVNYRINKFIDILEFIIMLFNNFGVIKECLKHS